MKKVIVALAVVCLLAAGAFLYVDSNAVNKTTFLTAEVERGKVISAVTSTGSVKAVVTVEVSSQISGQVAEVFVDFNDEVTRGQPIARLDQRTFRARVNEAQAALEVAKARLVVQEAIIERTHSDVDRILAQKGVLEARVGRARAELVGAERELERRRSLRGKGVSTASDFDVAETAHRKAAADLREAEAQLPVHLQELAMAKADLQKAESELLDGRANVEEKAAALMQAEIELERAIIRSPIDGVIIGRDVDPGQTVAASLEAPVLFTIANDLREMEVHAHVDEADIGRIRVGQRATFTVDSFPDRKFEATVAQVRKAPEEVENVVTYTVVLSTENPELLLLPGMTALVQIVVGETETVVKIPNSALRYRHAVESDKSRKPVGENLMSTGSQESTTQIWVLDEADRPFPVQIQTGISDARMTEVTSGPLVEGQRVIIGAVTGTKDRSLGLRLGF